MLAMIYKHDKFGKNASVKPKVGYNENCDDFCNK